MPISGSSSTTEIDKDLREFDAEWYVDQFQDVRLSGMDPAEHYLWIGRKLGRRGNADGVVSTPAPNDAVIEHLAVRDYANWLKHYDYREDRDQQDASAYIEKMATRPKFSIVMPTFNTPHAFLHEAIRSVQAQIYDHWELCIADDDSTDIELISILQEYASRDSRIKIDFRKQNGNISNASNSAIAMATCNWVAFLDHDDTLMPHALLIVADAINKNPAAQLFYSDEDKITLAGQRDGPYFKCRWNQELFHSHNMITHLAIYDRKLMDTVGWLDPRYDGAQDYDLALRCTDVLSKDQICHIPFVLYNWRILPGSTALSADEKPYAMLAGQRALNAHFDRCAIQARSELTGIGYKTHYAIPNPQPRVSIVIPTRNARGLVKQCIESIINISTYENYEIILIDNNSDDKAAIQYFFSLIIDYKVKIIHDDREFNFSAINNKAVHHCEGEILILLNNDTEVISADWIEVLVGLAIQPDVGAVGGKLLYPDRTVQHGGIVLGLGGLAAHAHTGFPNDSPGNAGRLALCNEFSAVTGACLAVRRSSYLAVGGLDEANLKIAYNDVDFCLRLRERGLRNVYTPHAVLFHHESATRGAEHTDPVKQHRFEREQAYMISRWSDIIYDDPAYSPNLSWDNCNFEYAFPPRVNLPWRNV